MTGRFKELKSGSAGKIQVGQSLHTLIRLMQVFYQKPVILLLDEYDVPMAKASSNGYYDQMLDIMKEIMSTALKDNTALRFAVITGCLKIAKESIFTGTNNFVSDNITDPDSMNILDFTEEVDQILANANVSGKAEEVKRWYDGYHFGRFDVIARGMS